MSHIIMISIIAVLLIATVFYFKKRTHFIAKNKLFSLACFVQAICAGRYNSNHQIIKNGGQL